MTYSVDDISRYIILYCKSHRYPINNLKLQKLLYFVQAQFLVDRDEPAFNEEIAAWVIGPVVPKAYELYRFWGMCEIPNIIAKDASKRIYISDQTLIDGILNKCACYTNTDLTKITLSQDPWVIYYTPLFNRVIPKVAIKKFFEEN